MESGIAYLLSVTPALGSDAFTTGRLHETDDVAAYNASFSEQVPFGGKVWRRNPGAGSAGQVSGELTVSDHIKGNVPQDKQKSKAFAAGETKDTSTTPPSDILRTDDEHLFFKKVTAEYCPASVFTGRCRLYVQAMYGQYLYPDGLLKSPGGYPKIHDLPFTVDATPSIKVPPFKSSVDGVVFSDIHITTSSGVYLDRDTGDHWLLNIEPSQLSAYPLVGTSSAERSRELLKAGSALSETDRDHLEAYILGCSLPDASKAQYVKFSSSAAGGWSLGYGWHWNYSGTCADFVENAKYPQDNEDLPNGGGSSGIGKYFGMLSTHYRLKPSLAKATPAVAGVKAKGVWSVSVEVVSPATKWSSPPGVVILTEVDWGTRQLGKVLPRFMIPRTSSATFYAFYRKDKLITCSVEVAVIPPRAAELSSSDPRYGSGSTLGLDDGWSKNTQPIGETYEGFLRVGDKSYPFSGWGKQFTETRINNKRITGFEVSPIVPGQGTGIHADWSYAVGYPNSLGEYSLAEFKYPGGGFGAETVELYGALYFTFSNRSVAESQGAYCIFIPPMNDSESAYALAETHNIKSNSQENVTNYRADPGTGIAAAEYRVVGPSGLVFTSGPLVQYRWSNPGAASVVSQSSGGTSITDDIVFRGRDLVCGAGTFPLKDDFVVGYSFLTLEGIVPDPFETRTSASGKAMICDPNKLDPFGTDVEYLGTTTTKLPTFVGWA